MYSKLTVFIACVFLILFFSLADAATVITGSFNFTAAAEKNAENLLSIRSKDLATLYKDNWLLHKEHSQI